MKWLAFSCYLLISFNGFCTVSDSLRLQLQNSLTEQDSFSLLYALSDYYEHAGHGVPTDSARIYSNRALRLAPSHASREQLILLHRNLANSYALTDSTRYFSLTEKVRDMYVADGDFEKAAKRESQMAHWFMVNGNLEGAREYHQNAIDLIDLIPEPSILVQELQARLIYMIGHSHTYPDEYDKAIRKAFELEAFSQEHNLPRGLALSYDLLGTVYLELYYYDEETNSHDSLCKYYFNKGAIIAEANADSSLQIRMLQSLGSIYYLTGDLDSATAFFNRGFDLSMAAKNYWSAYDASKYQVNIALKQGQLELGNLKIKEIESLLDLFAVPDHIQGELDEMKCRYHYFSGNYSEAKKYALSLLDRKKYNNPQKELLAYELLDSIEQRLGNWQEAHRYHTLTRKMQDSVLSSESLHQIDNLKAQHEFDQLKMRTDMESVGLRKTLALVTTLVLLLGSLLAALFLRSKNKVLANEKQTLELEHRLLRSQMNPHFTFNALGAIQNYLLESNQAAKGAIYLAKFSKLMRQILSQSRHSLISLKEEFETLENYLILQQLRFEDRFSYSFEVSEDLNPADILIPPMLIQPAVENSIEHGKIHTVKDGFVQITAIRCGHMIELKVTDNGVGKMSQGSPTTELKNHTSLATSIIKERMAMIRREHGEDFDYVLIHPDKGGTEVTYRLPLITDKQ